MLAVFHFLQGDLECDYCSLCQKEVRFGRWLMVIGTIFFSKRFFFFFKIFIFNEDAYLRNKIEMHASIRKDLNNVGYYIRKWMTNSYGTALL